MLGHLLRRCHQSNTAIWTARFGPRLTPAQFAVLAVTSASGGMDLQAIAGLAALDKSTMTGVARRLESGGWVRRLADPGDGRRVRLALTAAAELALIESWSLVAAAQEDFLAPINAGERDRLQNHLRHLARVPPGTGTGPLGDVLDELLATPGHMVRRAQQEHTAHWLAEFGKEVTGPQFAVLRMLRVAGPMAQNRLGDLVALDKSTLTGVVRRLALRGWIVRAQDTSDRRSRIVSISSDGRALATRVLPRAERVQAVTVAPVPPLDREWLFDALERLAFRSGRPEIPGHAPGGGQMP